MPFSDVVNIQGVKFPDMRKATYPLLHMLSVFQKLSRRGYLVDQSRGWEQRQIAICQLGTATCRLLPKQRAYTLIQVLHQQQPDHNFLEFSAFFFLRISQSQLLWWLNIDFSQAITSFFTWLFSSIISAEHTAWLCLAELWASHVVKRLAVTSHIHNIPWCMTKKLIIDSPFILFRAHKNSTKKHTNSGWQNIYAGSWGCYLICDH